MHFRRSLDKKTSKLVKFFLSRWDKCKSLIPKLWNSEMNQYQDICISFKLKIFILWFLSHLVSVCKIVYGYHPAANAWSWLSSPRAGGPNVYQKIWNQQEGSRSAYWITIAIGIMIRNLLNGPTWTSVAGFVVYLSTKLNRGLLHRF